MPGLLETPSSSHSSSKDEGENASGNMHARPDYPAINFPGYSEKPLDEQLEPIAVVGMGETYLPALP